jgi:hypothetical protein
MGERHHRHVVIFNVILLYCLLDPSIPFSGSGGCVKYSYNIDVYDDDGVILVLHSSSATTMVPGANVPDSILPDAIYDCDSSCIILFDLHLL